MKDTAKATLKIGRIRYINTLPFFHQLSGESSTAVSYYESYPARVNLALRKGKIDIAPISSLEYLNHHERYLLLPDLAIGARDFSGSVILFSREKIEGLNGETIALTRQSLSSSILLRILLKFKYKYDNRFKLFTSGIEETLKRHTAALVIGDEALLYRPKEFVYKYDLSELWWNWTEKPFCFALWAVRRECAKAHPESVRQFYWNLKENVEKNLLDIESLIKESLSLSFVDADFSKIFGYLFNLHYGLDAPMKEGLELFYRLAGRLQFSPRIKAPEFFDVS